MFKVYCDGASSNNGKDGAVGGWGFVILNENDEIIFSDNGGFKNATNQQMEITAVKEAFSYISNHFLSPFINESIEVYSDSAYVVNCFNDKWYRNWENNGWVNSAKKPVANKELWKNLLELYRKFYNCTFVKVAGHSDNKWNEVADALAVKGRKTVE